MTRSLMRMDLSLNKAPYRFWVAMAVFLLSWIPWAPARVIAIFLAAGLLPGYAIAVRSGVRFDVAVGVGAAISPVIFGAAALVAMLVGADVRVAGTFAKGIGLILFLALGRPSQPLTNEDRRALAGALVVCVVAAVLALSLPLAETWWRVREDSWFHAAVADKLARDGLPLSDPYFAGLRIQYMYVYHAIVAACSSLCRIDYFHAMILLNAMALSSTVFAFHALAGEFTRRAGPRVLGTFFWVFAMNGWFYLSYPVRLARAVFGETHGLEALRAMFPWTPPGHATAMSLLSVEGNQFMFLDKFMIGTALSLTFGLAATLLLLLVRARRGQWSAYDDVAFVLALAGSVLLHLVTGLTVAFVTAAVLAFLLVIRSQPSPGGPSYARLVGWIVLVLAATAPYLYSVAPREGSASIAFALQRAHAVGLVFDVLPALVLAVVFLRSASRDTADALGARPLAEMSLSATGILLLWTLLVAGVGLTFDLATNNETKFAFLVFLPLAALAVGALDRWWDARCSRVVAIVLVASATLPLHAIYFAHAFRDASTFDVSDPEKAVYGWVAKSAPRNAIVIEENDIVRIPVLASRDLYWGTEGYARNWGYPQDEMIARKRVRDAVFSDAGASELDMMRLRSLERPVLVVYRRHPEGMIDAPERFEKDRRFHGRFATPEIAVWELFVDE
ncbi:MAG TPA: hypothetical protein VEC56_03280 [Candidatus Krumholzibacteria bacterium]|nr:hypothetical protein [Candidatus Krumholzibacteria bacterium]